MSSNLKRTSMIAASGGAYLLATYITYQYLTAGQNENEQILSSSSSPQKSYVTNPHRTQTFQQIAYGYDDQIHKDEVVMGITLLRRALLYFHASGKVLEVGAGTGRNINYYPSSISNIVLTDMSDKMLLRARNKLNSKPPSERERFQLFVADAQKMNMYEDDSFDTVVDTFGLCSFDDPVAVLKELQRVCKKPHGKILLLEHGRSKTYEGLSKYLDNNAERHAKNWGCVWNRDIDDILKKSGLKVERKDTWHFGTTYYVICHPGEGMDKNKNVNCDEEMKKNECNDGDEVNRVEVNRNDGGMSSPLLRNFLGRFLFNPTWLHRRCDHCENCKD